ncbi:MAG: glycosyltransferase family 1 protein [Cyanobacteria bacterium J06554_11]
MANEYYIYFGPGQPAVRWENLSAPPPRPLASANYTQKTLLAMDQALSVDGLTVYVTSDAIDDLPSYGPHVVAVILGDEWARIPKYLFKVGAIFSCYGTQPMLGLRSLQRSPYLNLLTLTRFMRLQLTGLPYRMSFWLNQLQAAASPNIQPAPIYQIPLGYCNQLELPVKPLSDRRYDVSFSGSIVHRNYPWWSPNRWIGNPKQLSRQKMADALQALKQSHPHRSIELKISSGFRASRQSDGQEYSQQLMETKVCIAPRGTSFETFRLFEGLRYGCIVITEALPSAWFYDQSPIVKLADWSELAQHLESLLGDSGRLQEQQQASLRWWQKMCSEKAVGNYMAESLNDLFTQ